MTYTGDVTVGGPADTRELGGLTLSKLAVGPMDNNAYLLVDRSTGERLLIDAANEAGTAARPGRRHRPLATVVTTHRHGDHWQALARGGRSAPAPAPSRTRWTRRSCRCR